MNLSLHFIRGLIAAVNPCAFVLLPTYLMYFLGLSSTDVGRQRATVGRALVVSSAVSGGFLSVFLVIGLIAQYVTDWFTENSKYVTGIIGLTMLVVGVAMLFGFKLPINTPRLDAGGRDRTIWSMFVYGIAYAVASLGCTLPLFLGTVFGTARSRSFGHAAAAFGAYGAGMALLVAALTVALAVANVGLLKVLRSSMQYVEMVSGALVALSGAYLLWYFWKVDILQDADPLTDAVARIQQRASDFLQGNWQMAFVVLVAVVAAATFYAVASAHDRRRNGPDGSGPHREPTVPSDTISMSTPVGVAPAGAGPVAE